MNYIVGFARALFVHRLPWWISLITTYVLGVGMWGEYPAHRDRINGLLGWPLMPDTVPFWWVAVPFLLWVIGAMAHKEAMRQMRAARIVFGSPYEDGGPLYATSIHPVTGVVTRDLRYRFWMAKIQVSNQPYRSDDSRDIEGAWAEIEVFDSNYKCIRSWNYPRWEENKKPGYGTNPVDHLPDSENLRTLTANERPHTLCIALKPIDDADAYPIRGADQLKPDWRSPELAFGPGRYLVRIRVHGKGLVRPAEQVIELENCGLGRGFDLSFSHKRIGTYWP